MGLNDSPVKRYSFIALAPFVGASLFIFMVLLVSTGDTGDIVKARKIGDVIMPDREIETILEEEVEPPEEPEVAPPDRWIPFKENLLWTSISFVCYRVSCGSQTIQMCHSFRGKDWTRESERLEI